MLGQTEIDLEDRVLSPEWQQLCWPKHGRGAAAAGGSVPPAGVSNTPVELRSLRLGNQVCARAPRARAPCALARLTSEYLKIGIAFESRDRC